jgi:hypothetical protein
VKNLSHRASRNVASAWLIPRHSGTAQVDAALDQISPLVGFAIVFDWYLAVRSRRDHGLNAALCQVVANVVAVIALVAEEPVGIIVVKLHQRIVAFDLMRLAAGDVEGQRVAFGVRAEVDFGREPTARTAKRLLDLIPPFTPAACWCARMIVESMACSSSAGGPRLARVSNAASHTPSLLQRVNRTKTGSRIAPACHARARRCAEPGECR